MLGVDYAVCRGSIYRALGLMVAASPCALAVAPLAYATAVSSCARKVSVTCNQGVFTHAFCHCQHGLSQVYTSLFHKCIYFHLLR